MERVGQKHLFCLTFSNQQAILFILTLSQVILFEVYFHFSSFMTPLLLAFLIWRYILIVLVIIEVKIVISQKPTDPVLEGKVSSQTIEPEKLIYCILCDNLVFKSSHHCFRCGKCAYDFDHHCKYLNVCIGNSNYVSFLRLLATYILYNVVVIGLVLLQEASPLMIGYLAVTAALTGLTLALLVFHIYLNHCLGLTTIEYLMPEKKEVNHLVSEIESPKNGQQCTPEQQSG